MLISVLTLHELESFESGDSLLKRRLFILVGAIIALSGVALAGYSVYRNALVWNNTFNVTQPNILCNINVGDTRIVNVPVNVDVSLGIQHTIFSDDFESYATGKFPSQWTLAFNGMGDAYQVVVDNVSNSPTKSLQLVGNINWAADVVKYFSSTSPTIGFEVSVRIDNSTGIPETAGNNATARVGFWKKIDWGHAAWYESVTFGLNGTIVASGHPNALANALPGQVLQSWVSDQWYDVKLILDRTNRVFSVWINGTLEGENLEGSDVPYTYDGLAISGRYTQTIDNYDDVKIFEATIPSSHLTNFSINGSYSAEVQFLNTTNAQWQHLFYLQEATNITLTSAGYEQSYTFTPEFEGKYNVEVTFAFDSTVYTFSGKS
jgi:hypothetical protein